MYFHTRVCALAKCLPPPPLSACPPLAPRPLPLKILAPSLMSPQVDHHRKVTPVLDLALRHVRYYFLSIFLSHKNLIPNARSKQDSRGCYYKAAGVTLFILRSQYSHFAVGQTRWFYGDHSGPEEFLMHCPRAGFKEIFTGQTLALGRVKLLNGSDTGLYGPGEPTLRARYWSIRAR